jgi:hypothetical protein
MINHPHVVKVKGVNWNVQRQRSDNPPGLDTSRLTTVRVESEGKKLFYSHLFLILAFCLELSRWWPWNIVREAICLICY